MSGCSGRSAVRMLSRSFFPSSRGSLFSTSETPRLSFRRWVTIFLESSPSKKIQTLVLMLTNLRRNRSIRCWKEQRHTRQGLVSRWALLWRSHILRIAIQDLCSAKRFATNFATKALDENYINVKIEMYFFVLYFRDFGLKRNLFGYIMKNKIKDNHYIKPSWIKNIYESSFFHKNPQRT